MMAQYPGFEGFRDTGHDLDVALEVIKGKLTQSLSAWDPPIDHVLRTSCRILMVGNHSQGDDSSLGGVCRRP